MLSNAMPRIGTKTNNTDPQSLRSRVFVGNIDPTMSRDELELIFQRYGSVSALSVHKGYAFVQYNDELSARAAVFGENNKKYHSKYLDCNVASEPKPNRKRGHNFSSSESNASAQMHPYLAASSQPAHPPPQLMNWPEIGGGSAAKFARVANSEYGGTRASNLVSLVAQSGPAKPRHTMSSMMPQAMTQMESNSVDKASTKDILICGCCKGLFDNYDTLINHKAKGCRLRFICRCKQMGEPKSLTCNRCFATLRSSWELVLHHISAHGASLFVDEDRYSHSIALMEEADKEERVDVPKRKSAKLANGDRASKKSLSSKDEPRPDSNSRSVVPCSSEIEDAQVDNHGDTDSLDYNEEDPPVPLKSADADVELKSSDDRNVSDPHSKASAASDDLENSGDDHERPVGSPESAMKDKNQEDAADPSSPDKSEDV